MSGDVSDRKRLLAVTAGNLEHQHIYFTGHQDFFPPECVGRSNRRRHQASRAPLPGGPDPADRNGYHW